MLRKNSGAKLITIPRKILTIKWVLIVGYFSVNNYLLLLYRIYVQMYVCLIRLMNYNTLTNGFYNSFHLNR